MSAFNTAPSLFNPFGQPTGSTPQLHPASFFGTQLGSNPAPGQQSLQSAFLAAPASALSSAFPSPSVSPPPPAALKSAFASSPAPSPPQTAFGTPVQPAPAKPRLPSDLRPPSHLIAPKPPASVAATTSAFSGAQSAFPAQPAPAFIAPKKLSAASAPFTPQRPFGSGYGGGGAYEREGGGSEDEYAGDDGGEDSGGALEEEEAEIARLEEEKRKRKARFVPSSSNLAARSSAPSASSSSSSSAKLAVARAAGMIVHDDDDGLQDDGDELYIVNATTRIRGLCTEMCPRKELLDRLESHTVSVLELPPGTSMASLTPTSAVPHAVKKYRRAAAAQRLDPLDVRTEDVLVRTCRHLVDNVVDRSDVEWHEVHRFVTDRFRAVRSDFGCQGLASPAMVSCLEWMARFHILAFDVLSREPVETFEPIQNMEKLTQTLTSLRLLYRDNAASTTPFPTPHQPEMQGYLLLTSFNPTFHESYLSLPVALQHSAPVQFALAAYNAMREDNYAVFFSRLRSATYLQSALLLPHIARVRARALEVISRGYQRYPLHDLQELLCMDGQRETVDLLEWYGIKPDEAKGEVVFLTGGRGGERQQFVSNEQGLYAEDRASRLLASKRPSTKKQAIVQSMLEDTAGTVVGPAAVATTPALRSQGDPQTRRLKESRRQTEQEAARRPFPPLAVTASSSPATAGAKQPPASAIALPPAPVIPQSGDSSAPVRLNRDRTLPPAAAAPTFSSPVSAVSDSVAAFAPPVLTSPRHISEASSSAISPATAPSQHSVLPVQAQLSASSHAPAVTVPLQLSPSSWQRASHRSPAAADLTTHAPVPALPLVRSLSTQQRENQERIEREQQRQVERLRAAHRHYLSSWLRRWQHTATAVRRERDRWQRADAQARRWYEQGLATTGFLHWHASFCAREQRRVSEAEMRRMMSQDQLGLSAVHSGLMTQHQKAQQVFGAAAALVLQQPADSMDVDDSQQQQQLADLANYDDETQDSDADDEDHDMSNGSASEAFASPSGSSLDVASLVRAVLQERNPSLNQLFFHVLVSVDSNPSLFADLLLHKLSGSSNATRPRAHSQSTASPRRLLLPPSSPSNDRHVLSSYTTHPAVRIAASAPSSAPPSLHVHFRQHSSTSPSSSPYVGYQGALFLLSSPLGVEDLPSLLSHPEPTGAAQRSLAVPASARFEEDRGRLATLLSSLHRHSRLVLVVLYPLAASALFYLHRYGPASSDYFQQHAALVLTQTLDLTAIHPQLVSDVSLSPLFIPSTVFTPSYSPTAAALFSGYNEQCLSSALMYIAAASPPHPVLHRVDVPTSVDAKVQHCLLFLQQLAQLVAAVIPSIPAVPSSRSAPSASAALYRSFKPQLYVDHFNAAVKDYRRRLFSQGLKDLSWPPEVPGEDTASSLSSSQHLERMHAVLAALPLPAFSTDNGSSSVLEWSWSQCHEAVVGYLASFVSLSSSTASPAASRDDRGDDDVSIGSDLYSLYYKAELFNRQESSWTPERGGADDATHMDDADELEQKYDVDQDGQQQPDGAEDVDAMVVRVGSAGRLERLRCWHEWLEALIQHRLSELLMHPVCIEDDQHVQALVAALNLTRHTDSAHHSHTLPQLPASPTAASSTSFAAHANGTTALATIKPPPVKRRKVGSIALVSANGNGAAAHSNGGTATATANGGRAGGGAAASLLSAVDEEMASQRKLSALLSELEAQLG